MKHEITAPGKAFSLRPVDLDDADFILSLRGDHTHARYLHPVSADPERQRAWIAEYLLRAGDFYFVVSNNRTSEREGLVSVYDVKNGEAEWGRWILRPGSMAGPESAFLIYQVAFQTLGLTRLYCRTIAENSAVVRFHDECGLVRTSSAHTAQLGDRVLPSVEHQLLQADWPAVAARLQSHANAVARLMERGQ